MTTQAAGSIRRSTESKDPEPYPFTGAPLEGHLLGYIGGHPRHATIFTFDGGEEGFGLITVRPDGTATVEAQRQPPTLLSLDGREAYPEGRRPIRLPAAPPTSPVFHTARAIGARHAAAAGDEQVVETFMADVLGFWRGARWQEPVSTALMGEWVGSLHTDGRVPHGGLDRLKSEAREIHRQLQPIWRRRVDGNRLLSLDFSLGDGLTVYEIATSGPDPYEALSGFMSTDLRIDAVLTQLTPAERAVAMAWSDSQVTSWAEAASTVIALAPAGFAHQDAQALGERVRRKLKGLGDRYTTRAVTAGVTR